MCQHVVFWARLTVTSCGLAGVLLEIRVCQLSLGCTSDRCFLCSDEVASNSTCVSECQLSFKCTPNRYLHTILTGLSWKIPVYQSVVFGVYTRLLFVLIEVCLT